MKHLIAVSLCLLGSSIFILAQRADFVPGRLLVKVNLELPEDAVQNLFRGLDSEQEGGIPQIGLRVIRVPEDKLENVMDALRRNPNIEYAEPDLIVQPDFVPNDPQYTNEWHISKIQAANAWDTTTGATNVIIAICDTGVDYTHPDLAAHMVQGWNFYDANTNTADINGHGTKVAGVAAAIGNNSVGVVGVAMNCRIMPLRISALDGSGNIALMAQAITYAADHGARVANVSYRVSTNASISSAAQYLNSFGGVVTISSGNEGVFESAPDNPYVLTVGATDYSDSKPSWSNTGNNLDLVAPGVTILTTAGGGNYNYNNGTSFSAPCVAGVAALVISAKPSLGAVDVMNLVKTNANDLGTAGWDTSFGYGRVNASNSVAKAVAVTGPTVVITSPPDGYHTPAGATIFVTVNVSADVIRVELYVDGILKNSKTSPPFTTSVNAGGLSYGSHLFMCKAFNAAGGIGNSQTITVIK